MRREDAHDTRHGMLQSTVDTFLNSTWTVTELVAQAGSAGARAMVPEPALASVNRMLLSLRNMAEQAPQLTYEIDLLMSELHAKRLSIQAVTAELAVLDQQLEILERALAPVQSWSTQWNRVQHTPSFTHSNCPGISLNSGWSAALIPRPVSCLREK